MLPGCEREWDPTGAAKSSGKAEITSLEPYREPSASGGSDSYHPKACLRDRVENTRRTSRRRAALLSIFSRSRSDRARLHASGAPTKAQGTPNPSCPLSKGRVSSIEKYKYSRLHYMRPTVDSIEGRAVIFFHSDKLPLLVLLSRRFCQFLQMSLEVDCLFKHSLYILDFQDVVSGISISSQGSC